ncbi:GIN domain-containing protein [Aquimarina longa]|uniref:GIN domain-containing protein n=1 Tax=Aquimarina longa TaxID=1080221 RepID=UPI00078492F4|nr:DUF2807 domain-containing protein [Aquimarina longa]
MRTLSFICICLLVIGNTYSQKEKIKGNKIVSTERFDVDGFHTIEIYENFEVTLDERSDNQVKLETDSNLQKVIQVEVKDSILTITSDKELRRAKALNLDISYASELKKIILHDKVIVKSLSPIKTNQLILNVNDYADVFLSIDANNISCTAYGKPEIELHSTAKEVMYQLNDNSKLKGIVTADHLKVDLYQKTSAKLEGEVQSMLVRTDNDTDFYGEKLNAMKTSLIAEGSSDCYILTNEEISIDAKEKTEIYLIGNPKITIESFTNEAILYKKEIDYTPSRFRY